MSASPFRAELELARMAALDAGEVLQGDGTPLAVVRLKSSPTDIVTGADLAAERLIVERIRRSFPEDAIVTEESDEEQEHTNGRRWIIDPLDGTANYLRGLWPSAVSIALEVQGVLTVGVVYDHANDDMYSAALGGGAWLNTHRLWRGDSTVSLKHAFVGLSGTNFPGQIDKRIEAMTRLVLATDSVRDMGSSAMQLCLLAKGALDAHIVMDVNLWDVAAGFVIAREAGCVVQGFRVGTPATPHRAIACVQHLALDISALLA